MRFISNQFFFLSTESFRLSRTIVCHFVCFLSNQIKHEIIVISTQMRYEILENKDSN